jgi:hypothetical protein
MQQQRLVGPKLPPAEGQDQSNETRHNRRDDGDRFSSGEPHDAADDERHNEGPGEGLYHAACAVVGRVLWKELTSCKGLHLSGTSLCLHLRIAQIVLAG